MAQPINTNQKRAIEEMEPHRHILIAPEMSALSVAQRRATANKHQLEKGYSKDVTTQTHLDNASSICACGCKISPSEGKWPKEDIFGNGFYANNGSRFASLSPAIGVKGCDVYIGVCRADRWLVRFVKWLRAELESYGVQCFASDRSRCSCTCAHNLARETMESSTVGLVIVTRKTFSSFYGMEDLNFFLGRNSLIPIFFGLRQKECLAMNIVEKREGLWKKCGGPLWEVYGGTKQEWSEIVDKLSYLECKLEVLGSDLREYLLDCIILVGRRLGKRDIVEKVRRWKEMVAHVEHPFPRNSNFVGRRKELHELELMLFGYALEDETFHVDVKRGHGKGLLTSRTFDRLLSTNKKNKLVREFTQGEDVGDKGEKAGNCDEEMTYSFPGVHENASSMKELYGKGIACICGESGIGKTELLLEFTYKVSHRYKMVLWISGEARYFRLNYLNLLFLLGIDVRNEAEAHLEIGGPRSFKDVEDQAINRVRKELMRDIPYLLVIDNLESEKDWWDGRHLMEVLPHIGQETHIIISTQMSKVMNLQPLKLSYLSHTEALLLMTGCLKNLPDEEVEALKTSEQKLGRLPLGLAIFGSVLSEVPIGPKRLLNAVESMQHVDWNGEEDHLSKKYPYINRLLNFCLVISDFVDKNRNLGSRMVQASSWFAPSAIPIELLFAAAAEISLENNNVQSYKKISDLVMCMCMLSSSNQIDVEASTILRRLQIARITTKGDSLYFHDIIRNFAKQRGGENAARAVLHAVSHKGSVHHHPEHIWAASFLLFKFDSNRPAVSLRVAELLAFIRKCVLPLARDTFTNLSRCEAASKLLFLSEEMLKDLENSYILQETSTTKICFCSQSSKSSATQFDHHIYKEFALLRAATLETRAMMMLRGGRYDVAEHLCRLAINIKEVIYGRKHPKTAYAREIMDKVMRIQSTF